MSVKNAMLVSYVGQILNASVRSCSQQCDLLMKGKNKWVKEKSTPLGVIAGASV